MELRLDEIKGLMIEKTRKNANYIGDCLYGKNHSWETVDYIEGILDIYV